MRLRTEMGRNLLGQWQTIAKDVQPAKADHVPSLQHDTAYAHALVMAIAEMKAGRFDIDNESLAISIENRADELMRDWGFGDE